MEKLIELLNEYDEIREYAEVDLEDELISLRIISKWYWFIKWLLVNQKIDEFKLHNALKECAYINDELAWTNIKLTMLLSISNSPIDDLISYLK